jgi:5-methylcytosine-specific restriction endonuclease McrA
MQGSRVTLTKRAMSTDAITAEATILRERITALRRDRETRKAQTGRRRRAALRAQDRARVLAKTAAQCHICGGKIDGPRQADHVLAHSGGGASNPENYLPSHALCNNYRWDYLPEEFQLIFKIGVWARTQIEGGTGIGNDILRRFVAHEIGRRRRLVAKSGVIETP